MCGLAGALWRGARQADWQQVGKDMAQRIRHRGPDSHGVWCDPQARVLLSHVRLSIVDLSAAGHQPMHSACGRYVLVFNGEIYNHQALRARLNPVPVFRGHSDTETLLACFADWGVEATLRAAVGMFAFALWDAHTQTLTLGRDRLGEKPLFYGWHGDAMLFASELKALAAWPGWSPQLDRDALTLFLRHGYVPAPYSIWAGIGKLSPGCYAVLDARAREAGEPPQVRAYWSLTEAMAQGRAQPLQVGDDEAVTLLERRLSDSIGAQMLADVPLGAFLSGGVDSSTVVALMQAQSTQPVRTFTIGFDQPGFNEAEHAKAVASHLGTAHTELYVQGGDALALAPRLGALYDEPFADSSQIPTLLVAQLARQSVTVALSGDGGDELFAGYSRYAHANALRERARQAPAWLGGAGRAAAAMLAPLAVHWPAASRWRDKLDKLPSVLGNDDLAFYQAQMSYCLYPERAVLAGHEPRYGLSDARSIPADRPLAERMMAWDTLNYLPDDILVKVDRACMAVSLEGRIPLLDHRVVELAWQLPPQYKVRQGQGKWVLRQVLYRHVPPALIERPKKGFSVPVAAWLRGPLRDWAETLLDAQRLQEEAVLRPEWVRQLWRDFLSGRDALHYAVWTVLMFQAWQEGQRVTH